MAKKNATELSDKQVKAFMAKAHALVDEHFSPKEHLPAEVYKFLKPIADTTCQGYYSATCMLLGSMAALTNGASVQIWNQKATPVVAAVFQIGEPQAGKSRLFAICEEIFDACDDVVEEEVKRLVNAARGPQAQGQNEAQLPVTVKSMNLQSFTFVEFFYRCSAGFPQVEFEEGDRRTQAAVPANVWAGRAFNLDEAYEFFEGLNLMGTARADKDRAPSVHASTLNTLIGSGKTRRATRTSTNYGDVRGKPVSISILGNAHPSKFIAIDRAMVGNHTACTKERFLICLDHSAARHAALPEDATLPPGVDRWTWLPLTTQQAAVFHWEKYLDAPRVAQDEGLAEDLVATEVGDAVIAEGAFVGPPGGYKVSLPDGNESRIRYLKTPATQSGVFGVRTEFRISGRWKLQDPTDHVRAAARKVAAHFLTKPHSVFPFEDQARKVMLGNQVAQSVRAQLSSHDSSLAALQANAAGQQGVQAALMAALDFAAGGGRCDEVNNLPVITVEYVQCVRRLLDISVAIREMWRESLEVFPAETGREESMNPGDLGRAVQGHFPFADFADPLPTQVAQPGLLPRQLRSGDEDHGEQGGANWRPLAVVNPDGAPSSDIGGSEDEADERTLQFADMLGEEEFFMKGLGDADAMIFSKTGDQQLFKDRELLRRLIISGKSHSSISKLIDSNCVKAPSDTNNSKRRNIRASRHETIAVLTEAFKRYPRLGACTGGNDDRAVSLKAWPASERGQTLFHNQLMLCCRVPLQELSKKRAAFHDSRPQLQPHVDPQGGDLLLEPNGERTPGAAGPAADAAGISTPNTPPEGLVR